MLDNIEKLAEDPTNREIALSLTVTKSGHGSSVFVLPGGPGFSCQYLREGLGQLSDFATLYFLDYPGCGNELISRNPISLENTIDAVAQTMKGELKGGNCHVICHSFGALVLAGLLQQEVGQQIDHCVLVAPTPHTTAGAIQAQNQLMRRMSKNDLIEVQGVLTGSQPAANDLMLRLLPYYCGRTDELPELSLTLSSNTLLDVMSSMREFDHSLLFGRRDKLLYVFGESDFIIPDFFADVSLVDGRSITLPGGHFMFADAPERFSAAIGKFFML